MLLKLLLLQVLSELHQVPLPSHFCCGPMQPEDKVHTNEVRGERGDEGRGGRLQALPLGAVRVHQGPNVPRLDTRQDCKRRAEQLLGSKVCKNAGKNEVSDAGGPGGKPTEPC